MAEARVRGSADRVELSEVVPVLALVPMRLSPRVEVTVDTRFGDMGLEAGDKAAASRAFAVFCAFWALISGRTDPRLTLEAVDLNDFAPAIALPFPLTSSRSAIG